MTPTDKPSKKSVKAVPFVWHKQAPHLLWRQILSAFKIRRDNIGWLSKQWMDRKIAVAEKEGRNTPEYVAAVANAAQNTVRALNHPSELSFRNLLFGLDVVDIQELVIVFEAVRKDGTRHAVGVTIADLDKMHITVMDPNARETKED